MQRCDCALSGALSDRFGRQTGDAHCRRNLAGVHSPGIYVISHFRTTATLLGATVVMATLRDAVRNPDGDMAHRVFSVRRFDRSGLAIVYAVSIAMFGGTTQFAVTWLIKVTGSPMAPGWYCTAATIVGIVAMLIARESAPRKIKAARAGSSPAQIADEVA